MRPLVLLLLSVAALRFAGVVDAADQTVLGNTFVVKNPSTADKRKITVTAKEIGSDDTLQGDPVTSGATLTVTANGAMPSSATYALPAGSSLLTGKAFWSGDASRGFKYKDAKGENGPVTGVQLKRTGSGVFLIKTKIDGKRGMVAVVPPNPGTDGCVLLTLAGGDSYSVQFASGKVTNQGAVLFKVAKPTSAGSCVPATTSSTTTTTTSSTTSTTAVASCPTPPGFPAGSAQSVTSASATITDPAGAPLSGVVTFIVGLDLASNPMFTATNGTVAVHSPASQLRHPVFSFGDALTFARLEIPFTTPTMSLGALVTARLPQSGAALQPGATATSGGVSIAIAAGATVGIDALTYDNPDKQQLRAVDLPVAQEAAVVTSSGLGLELLFGVSPAGTTFCPSATVTVPNDAGWPANAAVEFYIQGGDVEQQWAPFGGWAKISDGQVSADATTVSTTPGEGFPFLDALFGVRLTPAS